MKECNYCGVLLQRGEAVCECGACNEAHPSRDWIRSLEYLLR
jgi:hypothetical protein